ncbi:MAG TPA: oligopeptide transporter, OPT family [Pyrinomonadaceae bacterium]|jgi:putative OPT family oligopeptide transporter|nr:oligopeptide transporter, OPT family [Pyrinomonadaceae bacterium]
MSSDALNPADRVGATNEYPDVVGARPANPYAAAFHPYIAPETVMPELTVRAVVVGTLLGMVFGASSLYLVLKVGLTVSASIPVAVISITLFRILSKMGGRNATILENNIVQTAGSAGESIAFGVGVTMPAIMILGFDLELTRVLLVSMLGGLLGILMMIPLRRALIVQQHGFLKYPEGTACAEVLKAGASDESRAMASDAAKAEWARANEGEAGEVADTGAKTIFAGFGIGLIYTTVMKAFFGWKEYPTKVFGEPFRNASVSLESSPALLGVGYIIGPRIAAIMAAGGVLAYLVLIPMISFFGTFLGSTIVPPGTTPINEMDPDGIRNAYVLYIGAGAVAAGGIISLFRSLPTIWHGLSAGLKDLRGGQAQAASAPRTDQDLSMKFVLAGIIALVAMIMIFPQLHLQWNILGALMIVAFGFLFVTVSSRLTGEIGSSSNPISGMTVATLLLTCFVFLIIGWTGPIYYVTALSIGAIVCIAASNGGTTSQDLKTGFLVGGTPWRQQIAILIGAGASALVLGPILLSLNNASTVYTPAGQLQIPAEVRVDPSTLTEREAIPADQGIADTKTYAVWHKVDEKGSRAGKYLVDERGTPVYFADPGINGTQKVRADGREVDKFAAPKATLMSYIIKGILNRELPWGLVLLGVMIAVVLEMAGIPSLAFAVGVYLPLSSSSPIFVGGMVRWGVDKYLRRRLAHRNMTEDELVAEGDKSPGVLLASGYIAGGAIAGIIIAFLAGVPYFAGFNKRMTQWGESNPFHAGDYSDALAMIPFLILVFLLYAVGREWWLSGKRRDTTA